MYMYVHICIFLISVINPSEIIKHELQNAVKPTVIKKIKINSILSRNGEKMFSLYKELKSWFNRLNLRRKKADTSLNFILYTIRYTVYNYCVCIRIFRLQIMNDVFKTMHLQFLT